MNLIIEETYEDMSRRAADVIAEAVAKKPSCVLGLATGSTPIGLYADLVSDFTEGKISFKDVSTYNLDEYRGLSGDHDQSYRYFMNVNLFDHVDIDKAATHVPDGSCEDADAACAAYEEAIEATGGVDVQLLGLGHNGHIGFNEPCDEFPQGDALRDADREHHPGEQPPVRFHRRGSARGVYHGHRNHHEGEEDPRGGQRRG